jgi:hypothetical protein
MYYKLSGRFDKGLMRPIKLRIYVKTYELTLGVFEKDLQSRDVDHSDYIFV